LITLGNGIAYELDGKRYRFDPRRTVQSDVNLVSHAHSDHIPSSFKSLEVVCSDATLELMMDRRRKKGIQNVQEGSVEQFDAGHIPGSNMFLVHGRSEVLYTGDFCTRKKPHLRPAKPVMCDVLIMEATYGKPRYVFPDHQETMGRVREWLGDVLGSGTSAVLYAYPLGKSQELASAFGNLPIRLHPTIARYNRLLRAYGFDLPDVELDETSPREPFVYMTSGLGKDGARVQTLRKRGAKVAAFSGWALDRGFMYRTSSIDEAFPLSDHCGYDELLKFVKACSPEVVYTNHGYASELARSIRTELGIDARPLAKRQRMIDQFC